MLPSSDLRQNDTPYSIIFTAFFSADAAEFGFNTSPSIDAVTFCASESPYSITATASCVYAAAFFLSATPFSHSAMAADLQKVVADLEKADADKQEVVVVHSASCCRLKESRCSIRQSCSRPVKSRRNGTPSHFNEYRSRSNEGKGAVTKEGSHSPKIAQCFSTGSRHVERAESRQGRKNRHPAPPPGSAVPAGTRFRAKC